MKRIVSVVFVFLFFVSAVFAAKLIEATEVKEGFHLKSSNTAIVKQAILKACASRKWVASEKANNEIAAVLSSDRYSLVVTIKYSNDGYTIKYKDSQGLHYDAAKNMIHSSYARWVENLRRDINVNINNLMDISGAK